VDSETREPAVLTCAHAQEFFTGHFKGIEQLLHQRFDAIERGLDRLEEQFVGAKEQEQVPSLPRAVSLSDTGKAWPMAEPGIKTEASTSRFELRAHWCQMDYPTSFISGQANRLKHSQSNLTNETALARRRFVLRPSDGIRLAWDLFGMVLIFYDMLMIPFELAFQQMEGLFSKVQVLAAMCFWTMDIVLTFFTGYYERGNEELSRKKIAWKYLRTWLLIDVTLVTADWLGVVLGGRKKEISLARMGKTLRFLRILRSLRLLRLAKLQRLIESFQDCITSEYVHIVLIMVKITGFILATNHVIACLWYILGKLRSEGVRSWINAGHFDNDDSIAYMYLTSLHWSLTQFTPASMDVQPRNVHERAFAVIVLVFALLVFSSFLSSITAAMTKLRQLSNIFDQNLPVLRRYLKAQNVESGLMVRILRCVQHQLSQRKQQIQETDVVLLTMLSKPLQMELRQQLYGPSLTKHPFFYQYALVDDAAMKELCNQAITRVPLSSSDTVFTEGSTENRMLFVFNGALRYSKSNHAEEAQVGMQVQHLDALRFEDRYPLKVGDWCSEGCLWTSNWVHMGTLKAELVSEVLALDALKFAEVTNAYHHVASSTAQYARLCVELMKHQFVSGDLSDLPSSQRTPEGSFRATSLHNIVAQVFHDGLPHSDPSASINVAGARGSFVSLRSQLSSQSDLTLRLFRSSTVGGSSTGTGLGDGLESASPSRQEQKAPARPRHTVNL